MSKHALIASAAVLTISCQSLFAAPQTPPATTPPAADKPATKPAAPASPAPDKRLEVEPADPKWIDRVPKDDRAAFDELLGWAPPTLPTDLEWIGSEPLDWDDLRGKVVVIQSFTTANMAGRGWPMRVDKALDAFEAKDLRIIALHTPEDADKAKDFLAKKPAPEGVAVAIDSTGAYCDALGIYKHPANVIIDRNGAVRYAALNLNGLEEAVTLLVAEPFDQKVIVASRDDDESSSASSSSADFPPFTGTIASATDIRGKRAPEFFVAEWLNGEAPNAKNKVVVVDFWATWCGPCVASIPHMNDLATKFRDDVVCVGISDEKRNAFDNGLEKLKAKSITMQTFQYMLALDPAGKMKGAINVRGIPHCLVMDRNWIVRWQGHPASLDAGTLDKIVKADKGGGSSGDTAGKPGKSGSPRKKRWTSV